MANQSDDRFLLKDREDERQQFIQDLTLDEKIVGIDQIVRNILSEYLAAGITNQCEVILVHVDNYEAACYIGRNFHLEVVQSFVIPKKEVLVCTRAKVEELIKSRQQVENQSAKIIV